jgi:hypothetical protein
MQLELRSHYRDADIPTMNRVRQDLSIGLGFAAPGHARDLIEAHIRVIDTELGLRAEGVVRQS